MGCKPSKVRSDQIEIELLKRQLEEKDKVGFSLIEEIDRK